MPCWLALLCRWWRQVVQHLATAQEVAEAYQQKHACRAAFQVRLHLSLVRSCVTQAAPCGPPLQHQGQRLGGRVHVPLSAQPGCLQGWH